MARENPVLLSVRGLSTDFPIKANGFHPNHTHLRAVDDVSFEVAKSTTLGIVGESGCGKTTLGRSILRLVEPAHGQIFLDGLDILALSPGKLRDLRRNVQLVFQDPNGSLNPRMTIGASIEEPMVVRHQGTSGNRRKRVEDLLERVGLQRSFVHRYPHELSGGQRQRVCIARAIALSPKLIVCDEPVSALDVSVQSQILNLLAELQRELGLTYLFISHNLAVVEHVADWIAVMYLGKIVEYARSEDLFRNPQHPYTMALFSAVPQLDPTVRKERVIVPGDPPDPANPPSGCRFHPRCQFATDECRRVAPKLEARSSTSPSHLVSCHLAGNLARNG